MFQLNLIRRIKCRPIVPMIPRRAAGPVVRSFIMAPGEIMKSPGPGAESPRGPTGESLSAGGTSKKLRYRLRANRNVKCRSAVPVRVGPAIVSGNGRSVATTAFRWRVQADYVFTEAFSSRPGQAAEYMSDCRRRAADNMAAARDSRIREHFRFISA